MWCRAQRFLWICTHIQTTPIRSNLCPPIAWHVPTHAHTCYWNCTHVLKNYNITNFITNNIAPMPTQNPRAWVWAPNVGLWCDVIEWWFELDKCIYEYSVIECNCAQLRVLRSFGSKRASFEVVECNCVLKIIWVYWRSFEYIDIRKAHLTWRGNDLSVMGLQKHLWVEVGLFQVDWVCKCTFKL